MADALPPELRVRWLRETWLAFWRTGWFAFSLGLAVGNGLLTGFLWFVLVSRRRRSEARTGGAASALELVAWIIVVAVMALVILALLPDRPGR